MTQWLEKNLAVLDAEHPGLAARVRSCIPAQSTLLPLGDGTFDLQWNGRILYEGRPADFSREALAEARMVYPRLLFFYGIGLGYNIRAYFDHPPSKAECIVVIEHSLEMFRQSLAAMDWTDILSDDRVTFFIAEDSAAMIDHFVEFLHDPGRLLLLRTTTNVFDRVMLSLQGPYYVAISGAFQAAATQTGNFVYGSAEDSYRGFVNILNNVLSVADVPYFDPLEQMFEGFVGIAVSTGPSLEHSIEWLKSVQDRAVIAASDSALRILLQHGITPHLVGCLERVPETQLLFDGLPELPNTWLVTAPVIWPETYQGYRGPKINMMRPVGQLGWFFPYAKYYEVGQSVSHQLLVMLQNLGCRTIALVGQDLAFDRHSERTHVAGIPDLMYKLGQKQRAESTQTVSKGEQACMVEGNDGQPILTMPWYTRFRDAFGPMIKRATATVYNVIPKNYGAKIPNAVWCDPREANALLGAVRPVAADIRARLEKFPGESEAQIAKRLYGALPKILGHLRNYQRTALDVLDSVSVFRQRHSPVYFAPSVFAPLFERVQHIADEMVTDDDRFYIRFFGASVSARNFGLAQYAEEVLKSDLTPIERIEAQIDVIRSWFDNIHYWAARMERFLVRNYGVQAGIASS